MNRTIFNQSNAVKDAFEALGIAFKTAIVESDLYYDVQDILAQFGAGDQFRPILTSLKRSRFDLIYNGTRWFVKGYTGLAFITLRLNPSANHVDEYNRIIRDLWQRLIAEAGDAKTERAYIKAYLDFCKPKGVPTVLLYTAIRDAAYRRAPSYRYAWYKKAVVNYAVAVYFEHRLPIEIASADYGADYERHLKTFDSKRLYAYIADVYDQVSLRGSLARKFAEYGLSEAPSLMERVLTDALDRLAAFVPLHLIDEACKAHRTLVPLLTSIDPQKVQDLYAQIEQVTGLSSLFQLPPLERLLQADWNEASLSDRTNELKSGIC